MNYKFTKNVTLWDICVTNRHATTLLHGFQTKRNFNGLEEKFLLFETSYFTVIDCTVANFPSYSASFMLTIAIINWKTLNSNSSQHKITSTYYYGQHICIISKMLFTRKFISANDVNNTTRPSTCKTRI
jgi:hypothetical protein